MINEWLEYNLKPLLNSVIALLAPLTANAGNILAEGDVASLTSGDNTIVSLTNSESSAIYVSAAIGTAAKTGLWKLTVPDGVSTKEIQKRAAHQTPNAVFQFNPALLLPVGKTVTLVLTPSGAGGAAKGFIVAHKT